MGNFYKDNDDIRFHFDFHNMAELAALMERETWNGDADYLPESPEDAVDNYRRVLEIIGEVAADVIEPGAEKVDLEGNTLNPDGTVTLHPQVRENLRRLSQAEMMGFTLPRKYGGINCPILVYTMATEIVSRGDCSFMNMFGLQGIADTIYAFASDEIRDEYLPKFASGEVTGAMVLTEPDAGSDLQAVRLRADQTADGGWVLNGVKRFITNGCAEVLLVLARSEHDIPDGRGLSLFICERSPQVKVRCLEKKFGIHGSPTCELVFDNTPARLIGERQRGLITYVMALMNGARLGIAAQSLGVAEAAYRLARTYANSREQFGAPIERLSPVAEMIVDMKAAIEASRSLTYETARVCDIENNTNRILEYAADKLSDEEKKSFKATARTLKKLNAMLTPMSKFYGSEMANEVTYKTIQVLGGSGYMKDYAAERFARDARITNIYEGTSQLQVVAAVRGVTSGVFKTYAEELETRYAAEDAELAALKEKLLTAKNEILDAVVFVKTQSGAYLELVARQLVESAVFVLCGHYLIGQAVTCDRKKKIARLYIEKFRPNVTARCERVKNGNAQEIEDYDLIAGPVPAAA
ncbi:MAG: acyl-CoA dehydrogenase family protein [Planctomycetaceae bacterium]|jgi:alkylation response protein AidB-like acyl-CoA dehydrogenase|nr:acyl-CoA dehydrogenase family protein [Planctomycetaceae bacterium]